MRLSCTTIAAGVAAMVGLDGSPPWRVVRVVLVARFTPRVATVASVVVGTVAATVGLTIGYSFLTRTGLSAKAIGAVLAAAGGLAALVAGVRSLVRGRGWARLAAVPVSLLVMYALVMPLATAVYATNVPRPRLGSTSPADRGLRYEDASFVTTDGVRLAGWYLPSANRAAVVLLHGASSTRSNVLDQAAALNRLGYGVPLFDARGHGQSRGRAATPGRVELWVVPGAGHTGGLRTQPHEWERRVSTFLEHALLEGAGR